MIEKTPNGRYRAVVYTWKNGKRVRVTKRCDTRKEAKAWEAETLKHRSPSDKIRTSTRTIPEALTYFRTVTYSNLRPKSIAKYEQSLSHFTKWCPVTMLGSFTHEHAQEFLRYVQSRWKGNGAVSLVRVVKAVFRAELLRSERAITRNPFDGLTVKKPKRVRARFLTQTEESRLLAVCKPRLRSAIEFLINTGLRRDEFRHARWDWIEQGIMRVEPSQSFVTKHGSVRAVPLNQTALRALEGLQNGSPYLFHGRKGPSGYNNLSTQIERAAKRAGLSRVTPHVFRYTFATRLFQAGVPIGHISRLLGHSDIATTERYLGDLLETDIRYAVDRLTPGVTPEPE